MSEGEFGNQLALLIAEATDGGLSVEAIIVRLEAAVEALEEGLPP
jgi:hypothetical protein